MSIVSYIIEFLFCSALLMALYKLLLEGRVSYRLARIYLVWSMVLAAVIPVLELPLYPAETIYYQIPILESYEADAFDFVEDVAYTDNTERLSEKSASIDWARFFVTLFWTIYAVVVMMNLAFVAWRLWQIKRLRDGAELAVYENYVLAVSDQVKSPFAFWRTIFLNRLYDGRKREQVILHELSHIRHNHTAERMMLELLRCIFWFNPFVWYAGSSLERVQEWQADSDVLREGYDVTEYRLLIFQQIFGCSIDITSGLYNKVTKKRFLMMTNFKRGRFSFIRLFAVIPLLVVMIFAFGAVEADAEEVILNEGAMLNAEPQAPLIEIKAGGKIFYNGANVSTDELASALSNDKPELINIKVEPKVNMQLLYNVQSILRKANVLRIKYSDANGNLSKTNYLPPVPSNAPYDIKILDEITDARIPAQNLFRVLINKNDKILCVYKQADDKKTILVTHSVEIPLHSMHILTGIIKEHFIGDAVTKGSADSEPVTYTLSDGRNVEYPMSEGIVSIDCSAEASYEVYAEVDKAVKQAFDDLRLALAKDWFGFTKTLEDLSEADLNVVKKAIPLKVRMAEPRGEEYTPSPKIQVSRGKLYVNDKEMTLDEMRRQYPEYERVGRFNLSSIDNWKSALILTSPDTPKIYVRKSGIGINEDEGNLTIQQLSKAGLDAEVAVYLCDKESVANECIDAIVEALVANKRVKTFCFHVMVTDERVGVCNYLVEKQADGSVRKVGFKPNDVVASQTSKRISVSISSCLTDISSFEEIEDGKIVIVKVEDGKIYENDVLTTLEALEKKYPKSMQLTREEGGLEYRKLFKSELIATSSNINQIYMNGNKLTYKRTSSGGKASNYNIVCSLQQIATESLSSEVSVYVESATAQEIEAVIKSLEANKSVKCFCIVPRSTSKAILVEKQADGSIKRFAPSPKESKADNPATSDKESDYRIPYGMYSPSGYDTRWEWTKLSQEKMEEVFEHVPAISIISSDELEVYLRREVDFIKAGKYKYRVVGDELFLSNESGESYKFPLTLTIKEGLVEMILGIKAKVAGVKLKEVTMLSELKK